MKVGNQIILKNPNDKTHISEHGATILSYYDLCTYCNELQHSLQ